MDKISNNNKSAIDLLLSKDPYGLNIFEKEKIFKDALFESFSHHINNNDLFRQFCENQGFEINNKNLAITDYPYLPVNIFKNKNLFSVPDEQINTTLSSSATSGIPSTISLDSITSKRQTLVSAKIISDYLGKRRRPFLILDEDPLVSFSAEISARAAATRGFLILCSEPNYFLINKNGHLSFDIKKFSKSVFEWEKQKQQVCIFGFTYVLYSNIVKKFIGKNIQLKLPRDTKIAHIGGWKKLESEKVSKERFLDDVSRTFCIEKDNIFDFYGFTEQMGLLYVSPGNNPKMVPSYSEIIIRNFQTLEPVKDGQEGLIQILTPLPHSYPGISVLTEDVGKIISRNTNIGGRIGTLFEIIGRASDSEKRGCGDIMSDYIA